MDILAARKKAAEQANARSRQEAEAAPLTAPQKPEQAAPPTVLSKPEQDAPPAHEEALFGATVGAPAAADAVPAMAEAGDSPRAVPAASSGAPEETRQEEIEMLSFRLGGEEYAVSVAEVREVLKVVQLTIVPNTPDYILGVISLRGTMLPIIDLCRRFGLATGVNDDKSRIVVVSSAFEDVGLLVDRVTGVFKILPDEIRPAPENIEEGAGFLRGLVRKGDRLYILLDLEKAVGA